MNSIPLIITIVAQNDIIEINYIGNKLQFINNNLGSSSPVWNVIKVKAFKTSKTIWEQQFTLGIPVIELNFEYDKIECYIILSSGGAALYYTNVEIICSFNCNKDTPLEATNQFGRELSF